MNLRLQGLLWTFSILAGLAAAHGGHENVPEGEAVSVEPLVRLPRQSESGRRVIDHIACQY